MATAKKAPAKSAAAKTAAPAKKRTPNAAFMKALTPSLALAAVVGPIFDKIAASMMDAFIQRAEKVYG